MSTADSDHEELHIVRIDGVGVESGIHYAVIITLIQTVITVFAPLRFWLLRKTRRTSKLALWSDGWFLFGWLVVMARGWCMVHYAWDEVRVRRAAKTEWDVILIFAKPESGRTLLAFYILGATEIWAFKMAFLCMYADLYNRTVNIRKYALWFSFGFIPLGYVVVIVSAFLVCRPLSLNWDAERLIRTGHLCSPVFSMVPNLILLILTTVSDFLLILLPLHILASLCLTKPEKRGIAFVFFIALLSVAAAVGKYVVQNVHGVYSVNEGGMSSFKKYHWATALWLVEVAGAEVAFVLPALRRVLLERGRPRSEGNDVEMVKLRMLEGVEVKADAE